MRPRLMRILLLVALIVPVMYWTAMLLTFGNSAMCVRGDRTTVALLGQVPGLHYGRRGSHAPTTSTMVKLSASGLPPRPTIHQPVPARCCCELGREKRVSNTWVYLPRFNDAILESVSIEDGKVSRAEFTE
jgi:hypothetical protein